MEQVNKECNYWPWQEEGGCRKVLPQQVYSHRWQHMIYNRVIVAMHKGTLALTGRPRCRNHRSHKHKYASCRASRGGGGGGRPLGSGRQLPPPPPTNCWPEAPWGGERHWRGGFREGEGGGAPGGSVGGGSKWGNSGCWGGGGGHRLPLPPLHHNQD